LDGDGQTVNTEQEGRLTNITICSAIPPPEKINGRRENKPTVSSAGGCKNSSGEDMRPFAVKRKVPAK